MQDTTILGQRRRRDISKWQCPDDTLSVCRLRLCPRVLAFMSHLFCWGRSQGRHHPFRTHTGPLLSLLPPTGSRTTLAVMGTADISQSQSSSLWQETEGHATQTRSEMVQRIPTVTHDTSKTTPFCCMNNLQENLFNLSLRAFFFSCSSSLFLNLLFHCL